MSIKSYARWHFPFNVKDYPVYLCVGNRVIERPFKRQFFPNGTVYCWQLDKPVWTYIISYQGLANVN